MKTIYKLLASSLAFLAVACSVGPDIPTAPTSVAIRIGASIVQSPSKTTLIPEGEGSYYRACWEDGDRILLKYSFTNPVYYPGYDGPSSYEDVISLRWSNQESCFVGEIAPVISANWTYTAIYPAQTCVWEDKYNSFDFGSSRVFDLHNDFSGGSEYDDSWDLMKSETIVAENAAPGQDENGERLVFPFERKTALVYFDLSSTLNEVITSAKLQVTGADGPLSSDYAVITEEGPFTARGEEYDCVEIDYSEFAEANSPISSKDFELYFNVYPVSYESMTLTVYTQFHKLTINRKSGGAYEAGHIYTVSFEDIDASKWKDRDDVPSVDEDDYSPISAIYEDFLQDYYLDNGYKVRGVVEAISYNGGDKLFILADDSDAMIVRLGGNEPVSEVLSVGDVIAIDVADFWINSDYGPMTEINRMAIRPLDDVLSIKRNVVTLDNDVWNSTGAGPVYCRIFSPEIQGDGSYMNVDGYYINISNRQFFPETVFGRKMNLFGYLVGSWSRYFFATRYDLLPGVVVAEENENGYVEVGYEASDECVLNYQFVDMTDDWTGFSLATDGYVVTSATATGDNPMSSGQIRFSVNKNRSAFPSMGTITMNLYKGIDPAKALTIDIQILQDSNPSAGESYIDYGEWEEDYNGLYDINGSEG